MRILCIAILIITTLFTTSGAVPVAKNTEMIKSGGRRLLRSINTADVDTDSNHEEREGLFSLPEELEELVETHHHIREVFTKWCLEKESPEEEAEESHAKPGTKEAEKAELYKKFAAYEAEKGETGRKHKMLECNV
ncbi:Secreted RxLR effector peptide protein [Phytophthora palmivora]|uniref:RxLR effector protein n=1 Tax=Phytophthora palmivora TaxID=4796 RepID=A0A2P4Y790_9STRA|nr:Secreted RxLR effector peptide protein [Phytophthora palmivora]